MKQVLLIVNPVAGTKKADKNLSQIISIFNRTDYNTHVYITTEQGDANRAVKTLGQGVDLIVCCGGDGTLNETVSGLIEAGLQTPIGYIPAGSTNDFAKSLHLSGDIIKAATQIVNGTPHPYDVGQFQDRYFTYVASFGAFTRASYATSQGAKNTLGHLAYIMQGVQEVFNIRKEHLRIEVGGETFEEDYWFGAVCNSTSVGGVLTLKPDLVDMSDCQFEVLLIRAPKDLGELGECVSALQNQRYDCRMITFRNANKITLFSESGMAWALDGEKADGAETVTIENLHQRIQLVH